MVFKDNVYLAPGLGQGGREVKAGDNLLTNGFFLEKSPRCSCSGGQVVWETGLCGHQQALPGAAVAVGRLSWSQFYVGINNLSQVHLQVCRLPGSQVYAGISKFFLCELCIEVVDTQGAGGRAHWEGSWKENISMTFY